ncbi:MAG: hypothetical protein FWH23_06530 [Bacteroidales bacterium]|nr:hypothetical protein [Bacteroidales bacterium]
MTISLAAQQRLSIDKYWVFYQQGTEEQYPASVPGTIHTDLLTNQLIPDPFENDNENKLYWIDSLNWVYETTFDINRSYVKANLVFEGLDTYADVFLDEQLLFSNNNMFVTQSIALDNISLGPHRLKIIFYSALKEIAKYNSADYYILQEEPRAFARKAQYHFGWDWGPRFVTMGIWKPVYLELFDERPQICEVSLKQKYVDEKMYSGILNLECRLFIPEGQDCEIVLREQSSGGDIFWKKHLHKIKGDILIADSVDFPFYIEWYPNGLGDPFLHNFVLELYVGNQLVDAREKRVGFKNIRLHRTKDEKGEQFYFSVNGHNVFAKGANWIPAESFLPRLTKADYHSLIAQAAKSNFNMLRVWGGGIYEDEAFYEACDEMGIMVWQDFSFACAMYPATPDFLKSVEMEATEQIRRISQHACLALWCGNNENEEGWHNWGWKQQFGADTTKVWDNYTRLFHRLLPGLIQQYDPGRDYHVSSPVFGWGKKESMLVGDSHYWGVWWGMEPFAMYKQKVPRFMSEYGFQGFPSLSTLYNFMPDEQDRYLSSDAMKMHQKHPRGYETIQTFMEREYKIPDNLEDYAYTSQLLQAYGMNTAIEAHRRAKPYCMGTLYWQFNDCWPVVSWSGIDYYKEWKALQYFVRKAYAQHLLSFDTVEDKTCLWAITDSIADVYGKLEIVFSTFAGKEIYRKDSLLTIPANSAQKIWECRTADFIKGEDSLTTFCHARFLIGDRQAAESINYYSSPKNTPYPAANLTVSLQNNGEIILQADQLVKNICILYEGKQSPFSDNFFDMLPGQPYTVKLLKDKLIAPDLLQLKSLNTSLNVQFIIHQS